MIKAAIFDLDGTILDRTSSLRYFLQAQYAKFKTDINVTEKIFVETFIVYDQNGLVVAIEIN